MTGRSIARNTRSGMFVGPGICKKERPLMAADSNRRPMKGVLFAPAPALANRGTIAVLRVVAVFYTRTEQVTLPLLILLGAGTTGAVLLPARRLWSGPRRAALSLVPHAGRRYPGGWRSRA